METFIGQIILVAFGRIPTGWALCDGSLLSIQQNEALYALLGPTFGGDGATTFGLPDLRGRFPVGVDEQSIQLGTPGGMASTIIYPNNLPPFLGVSGTTVDVAPMTGNTAVPVAQQAIAGGQGQPINLMPPYLGLNFIIALVGIFPDSGD